MYGNLLWMILKPWKAMRGRLAKTQQRRTLCDSHAELKNFIKVEDVSRTEAMLLDKHLNALLCYEVSPVSILRWLWGAVAKQFLQRGWLKKGSLCCRQTAKQPCLLLAGNPCERSYMATQFSYDLRHSQLLGQRFQDLQHPRSTIYYFKAWQWRSVAILRVQLRPTLCHYDISNYSYK